MYIDNVTEGADVAVELQTCIQEVRGSHLGQDTDHSEDFRGFPQSLSAISGTVHRFSHDHLLPKSSQLVLLWPCHSSDDQSPASHRGGPGSSPGRVMWDLWWLWVRFSPSTSVSPANTHSTDCSTIINVRGWYNRPISGRRTKWTVSHQPKI
jgi:hypothetical protein